MKFKFRSKIYLGFFSLLLLQGLVVFFLVSQVMKESLLEENRNRGISIGVNLAARMVEPILAMDFLRMKNLVHETVSLSNDIYYTFILDSDGQPLVHTFEGGFPTDLKTVNSVLSTQQFSIQLLDTGEQFIYDYAVPVVIKTKRLGTLRIGLLRTRAEQAVARIMISAFVSTVLVILIAGFVGTFLVNPVTRRIKILHDSTEQALRGNLDIRTAPLLKTNCWDIMKCDKKQCPAFNNHHHRCWYTVGTLCPTCVEGDYAKTITSCQECQVYKQCSGDELQSLAESFDSMTLSLKTHLSDLTDAETVLNEQKTLLQTILDAIPDFISLQDRKGIYLSVNRAFCKTVNKTKDEILGKRTVELFPEMDAARYQQEDINIFNTGHPLVKESKINGSSGTKWLHVLKIPVLETNGTISGLLCSGRDITELKKIQEQLTHAQKLECVGQLAAGIAHEINTPLGIILGYAQLLLEDSEDGTQIHTDIKTIVKQTKLSGKIVADLLKFSRRTESITTYFNINEFIEEAVDVVEHTFNLNQITIRRDYGGNLPLFRGDKEKLRQVFVNLLNNAFDAIGTDGIIAIYTRYERKKNRMTISIADTGHGISSDTMKKLFDPFFTTKGPDRGTGLGLSVSFGIIEEHGGKIEVYSPPLTRHEPDNAIQHGTEFIVRLPVI